MNNKQTLLLKISGASLKGKNEIIDYDFIDSIAKQIKIVSEKFKVAIVLGGGNIWRGKNSKISIERYKADQMGMLATMINSLAAESIFEFNGIKTRVFSAIDMDKIANNYVIKDLLQSLENNEVIILGCGTGKPFFTTDTGTAISAAEIKANFILMGKNNVDGVYSKDPHIYSDAVFYPKLTYERALSENLEVMDASAISICKENGIKTIVFKINEPNSIINALTRKSKITIIE